MKTQAYLLIGQTAKEAQENSEMHHLLITKPFLQTHYLYANIFEVLQRSYNRPNAIRVALPSWLSMLI